MFAKDRRKALAAEDGAGPLAGLPLIRSARLYSNPYMRLEPNVIRAACNSAKIFPRHICERFTGAAYSPKTVPWEPRGASGDSSPPDGVSLGAGVAQPPRPGR